MKKIQKDTIAHYQRMIAFAEAQDQNSKPDFVLMRENIGECWYGQYCPYCKKFRKYRNVVCEECPLFEGEHSFSSSYYCCDGLWIRFSYLATWKEWINCANKIIEYVKAHG